MDPDHVAAAGEQGHQYHLTDATTSEGSTGGGGGSWPRALFRCWWELTGKVAIVGAAALAAPVVVPPIILVSAASLALSVPFATYLASLAATERLMAALLPSFPAEPAHGSGREDDNDVEQEFLDASEEPGQENPVFYHCSTIEEGEIREKDEGVGLASPPLPRKSAIPKVEAPALVDEVDNVLEPVSFQESFVSRNGDKIEDGTTREEKESTKETVSLTTDISEFLVPVLGVKGAVVERREEDGVAVQQLGQDTHVLDRGDKTEESTIVEKQESTREIPPHHFNVSGTPVPIFTDEDNEIQREVEGVVVVEAAVEEVASNTGIVARELVDMHVGIVAIAAPKNETTPLSDLVACVSEEVVGTSYDGEMQETAVMEDTMRDLSDANIEDMQQHDQGVVCSSVSVASPLAVRDYEDVMSCGSTQDIPDICDETSQPDQETGLGYPFMKEGFETKVISGDKDPYTEAQVRQQLETVRTITGYRSPFSSTLAGELTGLYLFVGVEPPVSSRDASDLMEINAKLRLLKSIIGVD